MDLRIGVGLALIALSGCSGGGPSEEPTRAVAAAVQGVADQAAAALRDASDSGDWSLSSQDSTIDGRVVHAKRNYAFAEHGTWFAVEFTCIQSTGRAGLTIESYQGQPSTSESPGSAFVLDEVSRFAPVRWPRGRAKPGGMKVIPIQELFTVSDTYSNRLELNGSPAENALHLPEDLHGLRPSEINLVRYVRDLLPLSVEVMNGMGASELIIDPSPPVLETLRACGGDNDLVRPQAIARLQQEKQLEQEQKAAEQVQAAAQAEQQLERAKEEEAASRVELGKDCRSHGVSTRYISGHSIDCAADFPTELAEFNTAIDAIYAVAAKHGFLCAARGTRVDLVGRARQVGLSEAKSYVQQEWCGNLLNLDGVQVE